MVVQVTLACRITPRSQPAPWAVIHGAALALVAAVYDRIRARPDCAHWKLPAVPEQLKSAVHAPLQADDRALLLLGHWIESRLAETRAKLAGTARHRGILAAATGGLPALAPLAYALAVQMGGDISRGDRAREGVGFAANPAAPLHAAYASQLRAEAMSEARSRGTRRAAANALERATGLASQAPLALAAGGQARAEQAVAASGGSYARGGMLAERALGRTVRVRDGPLLSALADELRLEAGRAGRAVQRARLDAPRAALGAVFDPAAPLLAALSAELRLEGAVLRRNAAAAHTAAALTGVDDWRAPLVLAVHSEFAPGVAGSTSLLAQAGRMVCAATGASGLRGPLLSAVAMQLRHDAVGFGATAAEAGRARVHAARAVGWSGPVLSPLLHATAIQTGGLEKSAQNEAEREHAAGVLADAAGGGAGVALERAAAASAVAPMAGGRPGTHFRRGSSARNADRASLMPLLLQRNLELVRGARAAGYDDVDAAMLRGTKEGRQHAHDKAVYWSNNTSAGTSFKADLRLKDPRFQALVAGDPPDWRYNLTKRDQILIDWIDTGAEPAVD